MVSERYQVIYVFNWLLHFDWGLVGVAFGALEQSALLQLLLQPQHLELGLGVLHPKIGFWRLNPPNGGVQSLTGIASKTPPSPGKRRRSSS